MGRGSVGYRASCQHEPRGLGQARSSRLFPVDSHFNTSSWTVNVNTYILIYTVTRMTNR